MLEGLINLLERHPIVPEQQPELLARSYLSSYSCYLGFLAQLRDVGVEKLAEVSAQLVMSEAALPAQPQQDLQKFASTQGASQSLGIVMPSCLNEALFYSFGRQWVYI